MQYRQEWQLEKDVLSALETDSGEMNTSVNVESVIQKLPDSNQENDFADGQELEKQAGGYGECIHISVRHQRFCLNRYPGR